MDMNGSSFVLILCTNSITDWSQDKMDDADDAYDPSENDSANESSSDDSDSDSDADHEVPGEIVGQDIPPIADQAGGVATKGMPTPTNTSPGSLPVSTVPVVSRAHRSTEDPGVPSGWENPPFSFESQ